MQGCKTSFLMKTKTMRFESGSGCTMGQRIERSTQCDLAVYPASPNPCDGIVASAATTDKLPSPIYGGTMNNLEERWDMP